jgi:hypothetical protein
MSIQIQNPMNIVESMAPYVGHILLFIYHNKDGGNCIKVSFFTQIENYVEQLKHVLESFKFLKV